MTCDGGSCTILIYSAIPGVDEWVHLAVTYDGSVLTTFLNGCWTNSIPFELAPSGTEDLIVGDSGTCSQGFDGLVDDLRIYDRALNADEVAELAQIPTGTCYSGVGFPAGDISFADTVIVYDPGRGSCVPTDAEWTVPLFAVGPQGDLQDLGQATSLGEGGYIELGVPRQSGAQYRRW